MGQQNEWFYSINNRMGSSQYVSFKVKILNSTQPIPDSNNCEPSSSPVLYEKKSFISNNETNVNFFNWSVIRADSLDNSSFYEIKINEQVTRLNLTSSDDDYRFVFEVWVYNIKTQQFEFSWKAKNEVFCLWNMIWFKFNMDI